MLSNVSKKFSPANFVFAATFKDGVDAKSVQENINSYLSMYSKFKMTGVREVDPKTKSLGWNLVGLFMENDFCVDDFLYVISNHLHGITGVAAIIVTDDGHRHFASENMSTLQLAALDLQCSSLLCQGANPNQSLSIN